MRLCSSWFTTKNYEQFFQINSKWWCHFGGKTSIGLLAWQMNHTLKTQQACPRTSLSTLSFCHEHKPYCSILTIKLLEQKTRSPDTTAIPISVLLASSQRPRDLTAKSLILVLHTNGYIPANLVTYFSYTAGWTLGNQTLWFCLWKQPVKWRSWEYFLCREKGKCISKQVTKLPFQTLRGKVHERTQHTIFCTCK